jgi:hypothetical protein
MTQEQKIVTPETAKLPVPEVTEVVSTVHVPNEETGDQEAVSLEQGRETHREPGEILPENNNAEMRDTVLAGQDLNHWYTPGMPSGRMSKEEESLLNGLYQ